MLSKLHSYKEKGILLFKPTDNLSGVCNAPKNCSGIYLIYAAINGKRDLIYIGISGRRGVDGKIIHLKDGLRGRFLTGKTDNVLRKIAWPNRMIAQNIKRVRNRMVCYSWRLQSRFSKRFRNKLA